MVYESKTSDGTIRKVISLCRRIKTPLEESTVNVFVTWTEWVELVIHDHNSWSFSRGMEVYKGSNRWHYAKKKTHKYDNSEYNQINGDFNYCDNNVNFYCKSTSWITLVVIISILIASINFIGFRNTQALMGPKVRCVCRNVSRET